MWKKRALTCLSLLFVVLTASLSSEATIHESGNITLTYFIGDYIGIGNSNVTTELVDISVYPNPVKTILHLKTTITDLKQIQIFNVNGILLKDAKLNSNEVDFSEYPAGMYLIKIKDKKELEVGSIKVIKH